MTPPTGAIVSLRGIRKNYGALRPLRIEQLDLGEQDSVALLGLDQAAAEVLVNLITGAIVPDAGEVTVAGQPTTAIADGDSWLRFLDQFGIVSERAVLLDRLTVEQNLAVPFTLVLEELEASVRARVRPLADEVGLAPTLMRAVAELTPAERLRVRLARALAPDPRVLLAEHPTSSLPADEVPAFAADVSRIVSQRRIASVVITADRIFADAVAERVLTLQPATGELRQSGAWRRWFA